MRVLKENGKRRLVEELGPYFDLRYAIYDNKNILEVWFSDKARAIKWWSENHSRETWAEKRERERQNSLKTLSNLSEIPYDELPFF